MMTTRAQNMLRQLEGIGARVVKSGAVYDIHFRDEHIRTTDIGTLVQSDILLLTGKFQAERPVIFSKHARQ